MVLTHIYDTQFHGHILSLVNIFNGFNVVLTLDLHL